MRSQNPNKTALTEPGEAAVYFAPVIRFTVIGSPLFCLLYFLGLDRVVTASDNLSRKLSFVQPNRFLLECRGLRIDFIICQCPTAGHKALFQKVNSDNAGIYSQKNTHCLGRREVSSKVLQLTITNSNNEIDTMYPLVQFYVQKYEAVLWHSSTRIT